MLGRFKPFGILSLAVFGVALVVLLTHSKQTLGLSRATDSYLVRFTIRNNSNSESRANVLIGSAGVSTQKIIPARQTVQAEFLVKSFPASIKSDVGNITVKDISIYNQYGTYQYEYYYDQPTLIADTIQNKFLLNPDLATPLYKISVVMQNPTAVRSEFNLIYDKKGLRNTEKIEPYKTTSATYLYKKFPLYAKVDIGTAILKKITLEDANDPKKVYLSAEPNKTYVAATINDRYAIFQPRAVATPVSAPAPANITTQVTPPAPTTVPSVATQTLWSDSFEGADIASFWSKEVCCSSSLTIDSLRSSQGNKSLAVRLNRSDPVVAGSKRAEIATGSVEMSKRYRYSFSVYVPSDFVTDNETEIIAQWMPLPEFSAGERWDRNPAMGLFINGSKFMLANRWDSDRITHLNTYDGTVSETLGDVVKGAWVNWAMEVTWSYDSDGKLTVWKDGKQVYTRSGGTTFNDPKAPYLKIGIYKYGWASSSPTSIVTSRTLWYDDVKVEKVL